MSTIKSSKLILIAFFVNIVLTKAFNIQINNKIDNNNAKKNTIVDNIYLKFK